MNASKHSSDEKRETPYKKRNGVPSYPQQLLDHLDKEFPVPFAGPNDPLEPINLLLTTTFKYKSTSEREILIGLKIRVLKMDCIFRSVSVVCKYYFFVRDHGAALHSIHFEREDLVSSAGFSLEVKKSVNVEIGPDILTSMQAEPSRRPYFPGTAGRKATERSGSASVPPEFTCKVCMDNPVESTFVPCGHLATCSICSAALRDCPVCRKKIEGTVGTYI